MINLGEETQHISDWRQEHPQIIYEDTYVEMKNNKVFQNNSKKSHLNFQAENGQKCPF